ncbi:hypothetical protein LAZ67_19000537, partial [Cordylochernes scorpioides]
MAIFEEQIICIVFCFKLKKSATETYELIKEAFGDTALSRSRTFEWFSRFLKGREKVNDDQHTGRPRSLRSEENKLKIKELIKSNRRISIKDLSLETGLSVGLCHQIVTKDSDMIRTSSKFVPRILTEEQKEVRMDVCKNKFEMTRTDPEWMQKIITGNETWVYQYDPETKRQSSQWIERGEPKPKKARFTKSKKSSNYFAGARARHRHLYNNDWKDRNQIKKTPAKFIPRFLTNEQKLCRLATCEDMLEMTRTDPEWKDKIITGYETWVYGYDPETKHQSAEWRCQGELRPKKSILLKSKNKVLLVAFLDKKGIFHHEYLPAGQTVIKEMYLGILRCLREAIRKKRPEKWTNGGWILHHDNARPHTAHLMTSFLTKNGTQILLQPPYFPDIAPNDFFLFPKLKAVLKGRHFDTRDDIIEKSPLALKSIPKEAYKNCFDNGRNDGA